METLTKGSNMLISELQKDAQVLRSPKETVVKTVITQYITQSIWKFFYCPLQYKLNIS